VSPLRRARLASLLIAFGLLALVLGRFAGGNVERPLSADEREYLIAAGNILRYGTYSDLPYLPVTAGPAPPPTSRRPPAYPLFIAAVLAASGEGTSVPAGLKSPGARAGLGALRWSQAVLLALTAWMACAMTRQLTGRRGMSLFAGLAVGCVIALDGALNASAHRFLSESLALPLIVGLSWSLMVAVARPSRVACLASGLLLAALVLTRPLLLYAVSPIAAIIVWGCYLRGASPRRAIIDVAIFLAAFAPPVLGWMTRNLILQDRFYIAEGAGLVVGMRAELNGMSGGEYAASALYWSGSRLARGRLLPALTSEWTGPALEAAENARFDRVMDRRAELRRTHRWPQADAAHAGEAMKSILESPADHIRLTPLMFLRGCGFHSSFALGLLMVLAASWATMRALLRRDAGMTALLAPAMLLILLNALLTHGIPRYTVIAIPILWCAIAWLLFGSPGSISSDHDEAMPEAR